MVRRRLDGRPVGRDHALVQIGAQHLQQPLAVDGRLVLLTQVAAKPVVVGHHAAVAVLGRQLLDDVEAAHPGQGDPIAPVVGFAEVDDAPAAAGAVDVRLAASRRIPGRAAVVIRVGFGGLDHADHPGLGGERRLHHVEVARLENIERQLATRQEQDAGEREHRDDTGQVLEGRSEGRAGHENSSAENLRRPSTHSGSVDPSASKNCSS